jgi:hypothetical protein
MTFHLPYQPGVNWIYRDRYPIPADQISWNRLMRTGRISLVGKGMGLIETLGGMAIAEALDSVPHTGNKDVDVVWRGGGAFRSIIDEQSIMKIEDPIDLPDEVSRYVVPYFMDTDGNQYLNVSFNRKMSAGTLTRVINASCRPFQNIIYRKSSAPSIKEMGIDPTRPIVLILPERTGWSKHSFDAMAMSVEDVRRLLDLLVKESIQPILMVKGGNQYNYMITNHGKIFYVDLNPLLFLQLLRVSKGIISKDIDCILAALMVGESKIFAIGGNSEHSPMKNAKAVGAKNHIYTRSKLNPHEIMQQLKDRDGRMATNRYWFREVEDDG